MLTLKTTSKITKTARHGELRPSLELTNFSGKNLCVFHRIDVCLERTKAWRKNKGHLLLSFINPNNFLPPKQFLDRLLKFCLYLELTLWFLRSIQQDQPPHQNLSCWTFLKRDIGQRNPLFKNSIFVILRSNGNKFNNHI